MMLKDVYNALKCSLAYPSRQTYPRKSQVHLTSQALLVIFGFSRGGLLPRKLLHPSHVAVRLKVGMPEMAQNVVG